MIISQYVFIHLSLKNQHIYFKIAYKPCFAYIFLSFRTRYVQKKERGIYINLNLEIFTVNRNSYVCLPINDYYWKQLDLNEFF